MWGCSLEPDGRGGAALRLGLCLASGLSAEAAGRLLQARRERT